MKSYKCTNLAALLLMLAALPACEKRELPDSSGLKPGGVSTSQMLPNVSLAGGFSDTKAGDGLGEPVNVYGSEDDGFMITEYVSDMNDIAPMTRGTEITKEGINALNKSIGVLGYYEVTETPVTQPIAAKGLDIDGSCTCTSTNPATWGWDAATTQYTTTYDASGNYTNAMTAIDGTPMWRINSTERIWSIYPASSTARIPFNDEGDKTDFKSAIDPESPSSFKFKYTVSTTLENQEDLIFAYNKEARRWKKAGTAPDPNAWVWDDGTNTSFNIKFYHAMAAVKFELSNAATVPAGTNVHSITLCYMDASKNIVKNVGVARYGECEVTGADANNSVGFSWGNLGTYRPLHYTYADTYSTPIPDASTVAGGYAKNGNGVMFMVPQTIPHTISTTGGTATLKIIVEFSKYGSTQYHAVVKDFTSSDVTWNAGNYYKYQLKIGEFHVPGELMSLSNVWFSGLKTATGTTGFLQPDSPMPTKGVSKVGLVIDGYGLGKKSDQYVYLGGVKDGVDQLPVTNNGGVQTPTNAATSFTYSFAGVSTAPVPNTGGQIYEFGLNNTTETYYSYYQFSNTLDGTEQIGDIKVNIKDIQDIFLTEETEYYVFDTTGADKFQVIFKPSAGSNDGGFKAKIRCMIILEIIKDANLPGNWDDFLANLSDYL